MNTYYLVKAKVTHTEYIAVKASDEDAAEYIAAGVINGIIDPEDSQNEDFVAALDCTDFEIEEAETVDITEATDMCEAIYDFDDYLDNLIYGINYDNAPDDNEGESEEFFSD